MKDNKNQILRILKNLKIHNIVIIVQIVKISYMDYVMDLCVMEDGVTIKCNKYIIGMIKNLEIILTIERINLDQNIVIMHPNV